MIEQLKCLKEIKNPITKYDTLKMSKDEFVRHFICDQVLGPINLALKKMSEIKSNVPLDTSYLPCDLLYCIYNKSVKEQE